MPLLIKFPGQAQAGTVVDGLVGLADLAPTGRWADLGSGAGFPGMVLAALYPDLEVDLVESRQKRCIFLDNVIGEAGDCRPAVVRVVRTHVEELPDASYDGITARAFAPPEAVLDHARRLLRPAGRVVLFLQSDAAAPAAPDFAIERDHAYRVDGRGRRAVTLRRR